MPYFQQWHFFMSKLSLRNEIKTEVGFTFIESKIQQYSLAILGMHAWYLKFLKSMLSNYIGMISVITGLLFPKGHAQISGGWCGNLALTAFLQPLTSFVHSNHWWGREPRRQINQEKINLSFLRHSLPSRRLIKSKFSPAWGRRRRRRGGEQTKSSRTIEWSLKGNKRSANIREEMRLEVGKKVMHRSRSVGGGSGEGRKEARKAMPLIRYAAERFYCNLELR